MSFWKKVGKIAAPIAGVALGGMIGGPVGAMAGGALGAGVSGMLGADDAAEAQRRANQQNYEMQKEFAQHGVRWKVEDARAAGINPLAAMGANTQGFTANIQAEPTFDGSQMGQDIGRAIASTGTAHDRALTDLQVKSATLDLQGKEIDNAIKASQLAKLHGVGPSFPDGSDSFIAGQGNSGPGIVEKPLERTRSLPGSPQSEIGSIPDMGWAKTKTGIIPIPSADVKNRIEDNTPHEISHFFRNNIAPNWGGGTTPPKSALPKGYDTWRWDHFSQEYQPHKLNQTGKPSPGRGWWARD